MALDPDVATTLQIIGSLLLGGGGAYGISRARGAMAGGGQQPQPQPQPPTGPHPMTSTGAHTLQDMMVTKAECIAHHTQLEEQQGRVEAQLEKGSQKMDALRDTITDMTVEVRTGLASIAARAETSGRDAAEKELVAHERRWHPPA